MKIGIVPAIKENYKNQFEYLCDINLIKFLKKTFDKADIEILTFEHRINKDYKLVVISGANGNDLLEFNNSKKNKLRKKIDDKFFYFSQKLNIPIIGICHGAQYLAKKFYSKVKLKYHVGNHFVKFTNNSKKILVNSYHTKVIESLGKSLISKANAHDGTIEFFIHKKKKITGIMWHPERYKSLKNIDKRIFKESCN